MSLEIERRFIVKNDLWRESIISHENIKQGYLASTEKGWTVRIRISNEQKSWITLKTIKSGITNYEFEYLIPIVDALAIWQSLDQKIIKDRYQLILNGSNWIIDCFNGENFPLTIAEIELDSEKQTLKKPSWCGKEITGQYQLSNASLAKTPLSQVPLKARCA